MLFIVLLSAYVTLSVSSDLRAVKETLDSSTRELEAADVAEAEMRLRDALDRLDSPPARMLRFVPVIGQNVGSLKEVVAASIPTLEAGLGLNDAFRTLDSRGLVREGRIQLAELEMLREPVALQIATLRELTRSLSERRNGWLVPPLWDALDSLGRRSEELLADAEGIEKFLQVGDAILGGKSPRTYLVLLINNSELRGAGGILSGVGTIELRNGRLRLGGFTSVHDLRDRPPQPVPAPPAYERRFATYKANTTLWLNATFSPDVPETALVASRLYELKTGVESDGVLTIDPRGVAALLPEDATIDLPETGVSVAARDAARFIYSDAYEIFDDQLVRRDAILEFGRAAFSLAIERGLGGEEGLLSLATAFGSEHIRFSSFDTEEESALAALGVTGELAPEPGVNKVQMTVQNFGGGNGQGTKLDFWARRRSTQRCFVRTDEDTVCETETRLANEAPDDLISYVAGRDGVLRSYLETYLPGDADVDSVEVNGDDHRFRIEEHDGLQAVGIYIEVPRGEAFEVRVSYSLPPAGDGFLLAVEPQPLTSDAMLEVEIRLPSGWVELGPGELDGNILRFDGPLDRSLLFEGRPDPRSGIPALWQAVKNFWNRPLF